MKHKYLNLIRNVILLIVQNFRSKIFSPEKCTKLSQSKS
jgi:hypothetical protein